VSVTEHHLAQQATIALLGRIVALACEIIGDSDKKGAYFCRLAPDGCVLYHESIGEMPDEKKPKRRVVSLEKAARLRIGMIMDTGHVSSWQSRDPDHFRWGGSIALRTGVVDSISGFTEEQDEACMLVLYVVEDCTRDSTDVFKEVVRLSGNKFASVLLRAWDDRHPVPTT